MLSVFLSFSYSFYIYFSTKSSSLITIICISNLVPPLPRFEWDCSEPLSDVHLPCQIIIPTLRLMIIRPDRFQCCDDQFWNCKLIVAHMMTGLSFFSLTWNCPNDNGWHHCSRCDDERCHYNRFDTRLVIIIMCLTSKSASPWAVDYILKILTFISSYLYLS